MLATHNRLKHYSNWNWLHYGFIAILPRLRSEFIPNLSLIGCLMEGCQVLFFAMFFTGIHRKTKWILCYQSERNSTKNKTFPSFQSLQLLRICHHIFVVKRNNPLHILLPAKNIFWSVLLVFCILLRKKCFQMDFYVSRRIFMPWYF